MTTRKYEAYGPYHRPISDYSGDELRDLELQNDIRRRRSPYVGWHYIFLGEWVRVKGDTLTDAKNMAMKFIEYNHVVPHAWDEKYGLIKIDNGNPLFKVTYEGKIIDIDTGETILESVQKEQSYISTQQQAVLKDLIVQAGGTLNVNIMGNSGDNRDILNVRVYDKDDSKKYRDLKINRYGTIMESSSIGFLSHTNYGKRDAYDKGFVAGYEGENWNYAGDYADDYEGGFKDGKVKRQSEINHHVLATESVKINEEVGEYSYWAIYFPNEGFGQTLYKAMPIDADEEDVLRQAIIDKEMEVSESNSVEVTRVDKAEYDNSVE